MPPPSSTARRDRGRPRGDPAQHRPAARARRPGCRDSRRRLMVVVKADGYGHGMVPGGACRARGRRRLAGCRNGRGGLALRAAGDTGRLLCWLAAPGADFAPLVAADVDVTASSGCPGRRRRPRCPGGWGTARLQLKFDTGLSRSGAPRDDWLELVTAARLAQDEGAVVVTGHVVPLRVRRRARAPGERQPAGSAFDEACALAVDAGLEPEVRHLANSAGALLLPDRGTTWSGSASRCTGSAPRPTSCRAPSLGLVPAMTVRGTVVLTKELQAGDGVSYGHTFVAPEPMRVALVPMGYGDGRPAPRLLPGGGADRRRSAVRCWGGSAWTSSWSALPRRGPVTRWCSSVRGLTGSPRRPTGRAGAGRSTTRS